MLNGSYRFDSFEQVVGAGSKMLADDRFGLLLKNDHRENLQWMNSQDQSVSTLLFLADGNRNSPWYTYTTPSKKGLVVNRGQVVVYRGERHLDLG